MYSFYAIHYYYKVGDHLCDAANEAIDKLTKRSDVRFNVGGLTRINIDQNPPVDTGCTFTKVPAFVSHGQVIYEAKGDETEEDWEKLILLMLNLAGPSTFGAR